MRTKPTSWLLRTHSHCADVLMDDYGIAANHRVAVCKEIDKIYTQISLIHAVIIAGVQGWAQVPETADLEAYLETLKTHTPKNQNPKKKVPPD